MSNSEVILNNILDRLQTKLGTQKVKIAKTCASHIWNNENARSTVYYCPSCAMDSTLKGPALDFESQVSSNLSRASQLAPGSDSTEKHKRLPYFHTLPSALDDF